MTGRQVIQAIKLALDKYSASTSAVIGPAFLDEELCSFANQAMLEIICTKFTGNNQLQQGFEQSVKRVADLEKLIVEKVTQIAHVEGTNRWITTDADFEDCMFLVSARIKMHTKNNEIVYTPAELADRQTTQRFELTPTNCPYIPIPKVISTTFWDYYDVPIKGATVYVDPLWNDKYAKFELVTEHVKQPSGLNADDLDVSAFSGGFSDSVLYEIIDRAALLALDNIESQRVETKAALNKMQE